VTHEALYTVDRATIGDAAALLRCLRAAFEPYRARYTAAAYEDTVMNSETVRQRLETMIVFVARDRAGAIVGTIGGQAHGDEGHIRGMAVVPEWQGRGVAEQLLERVEAALAAAGCSIVTLDTTAPLVRAIGFYERHGYVASGTVTDFFGMALYEYRRRLSGELSQRHHAME
jgi:ribosomal protein S18 acetylase RimI-like enzyme